MKEYKLMPHGFLSYNFPVFGMRDESLAGIRVAEEFLRELLDDKEETKKELIQGEKQMAM
jgi:hypothetical protein